MCGVLILDIFAKCTQAQAALKRTQYKAIANGDEPYFGSSLVTHTKQ